MVLDHQKHQKELIEEIEKDARNNTVTFSTVSPVYDYERDTRICLTSVHFPSESLVTTITKTITEPLKAIERDQYYYPLDALHITIKNIRLIHDPKDFDERDCEKAKKVFATIIPKHQSFRVYFYTLILFPSSLSLIGTTDPELDMIIGDLDTHLKKVEIYDNKKYKNNAYFFANMTLVRFYHPPSSIFQNKVKELIHSFTLLPYNINSVTLLSGNAVTKKRKIFGTWDLQPHM